MNVGKWLKKHGLLILAAILFFGGIVLFFAAVGKYPNVGVPCGISIGIGWILFHVGTEVYHGCD